MPGQAIRLDPAIASQAAFRAVMDAMSHPGDVRRLSTTIRAPAPLRPAAAAVVCALMDFETPVWLDGPLASAPEFVTWLRFETGAPVVAAPEAATFAIIADPLAMPSFSAFALGSHDYPDRSVTLLVQVERFGHGEAMRLSGPGLARPRGFSATPLPEDFIARLHVNRALFPRGVDIVLASDDAIAALPRSVRAEPEGD
jgi:alpha-D-ribose 1-methylphosphonate 5-triphosphate synthase subunit PhnH